MKRILIVVLLCIVSCFTFSQPPVPSTHGGWNYRESVGSPSQQYRYYNVATNRFEPMQNSVPLGTCVSLLMALSCGYVCAKIYRNTKIRTEK